ncbi:MAG: hypothetical protein ACI308_09500 [Muribaculaceae bacterium]
MIATSIYNKLDKSDNIFASLTIDGRPVASINRSNFCSLSEVVKLMYHIAGQFAGMARLLIRNQSQGWSTTLPLSSNKPASKLSKTPSKPTAVNGQYLIPW